MILGVQLGSSIDVIQPNYLINESCRVEDISYDSTVRKHQ
jgi:hypothetical protein